MRELRTLVMVFLRPLEKWVTEGVKGVDISEGSCLFGVHRQKVRLIRSYTRGRLRKGYFFENRKIVTIVERTHLLIGRLSTECHILHNGPAAIYS